MAVELQPERGALWLDNPVLSSEVANATSQHANYPANNLLTPHRSDSWRSTNASGNQQVVFDTGSTRTPTCFALTDVNFSDGTFIQFLGSDDSNLSVNQVAFVLPLYEHDPTGKVLRWYLGTPTVGTMGTSTNPADAAADRGRRYWGFKLVPGTYTYDTGGDDFFEVGNVWLGEYTPIRPWAGTRIRTRNPSTRTRAYGRAMWSDPLTPGREVEVPIGGLTMEEAYAFEMLVRAQGSRHAILDLHAYSTDAVMKRGGCMYGYFAEDPIDVDIDSPENNSVSFAFEEATG